jgi:predicted PurR-regulated permease PerM
VLTAIVIASAIEPGVGFFVKRRFPRVLAVLMMYFLVFGSLFSFVYFFFPPILEDAGNFISVASQYLDNFNLPGVALPAPHLTAGSSQVSSILNGLLTFRSAFTDPSAGAFKIVSTFFGGIFSFVLVIVLSFYFAVQDTGVEEFLKLVTPAQHEQYVVSLWRRAQRKIGLWMQGQLLSSLIGGVIAYLGLLILGVPYALLLAGFTAIAMLVPIFGSFISAAPAIIIAFSTGDLTLALIVAGLYLIINQFEAHLIHPLVVNKVVGIPPLLVILALIIGGDLAGFLGVVLAIPTAAALREFLADMARGKKAKAQGA